MRRRRNPGARHHLSGFHGHVPYTTAVEPKRIPEFERGGRNRSFLCRVLGFDLFKVNGPLLRSYHADFLGGHHKVYGFIPRKEIWLDKTFFTKEWPGFIAAHEVLESVLMNARQWPYERAHNAANDLEQQLRATERDYGHRGLEVYQPIIWQRHLKRTLPGLEIEFIDEMAQQAARQLWNYL